MGAFYPFENWTIVDKLLSSSFERQIQEEAWTMCVEGKISPEEYFTKLYWYGVLSQAYASTSLGTYNYVDTRKHMAYWKNGILVMDTFMPNAQAEQDAHDSYGMIKRPLIVQLLEWDWTAQERQKGIKAILVLVKGTDKEFDKICSNVNETQAAMKFMNRNPDVRFEDLPEVVAYSKASEAYAKDVVTRILKAIKEHSQYMFDYVVAKQKANG